MSLVFLSLSPNCITKTVSYIFTQITPTAMSEFTNHKNARVQSLIDLTVGMIEGGNGAALYKKYEPIYATIVPHDVIAAVDGLVLRGIPMDKLKVGVGKMLNILYKQLNEYKGIDIPANSFIGYLVQNNSQMDERLKAFRPLLKEINAAPHDKAVKATLEKQFAEMLIFEKHYTIKENILFPILEKQWPDYRCLQIMWSLHDDIRRNLKAIVAELQKPEFSMVEFNILSGDIFFDMYAIKFREEKILFPMIMESIPMEEFAGCLADAAEIGFPYVQPSATTTETATKTAMDNKVDLHTGALTPEQIRLVFNHLPVDITYVDENDQVQFFSTPPHRIFTRTKAIIGREVKNCHPPQSVHVVEKIVESFRSGARSSESFWIHMGPKFILIQYFAVRDEQGVYRGVVEVSQEISEIQRLEGDKRLLDE